MPICTGGRSRAARIDDDYFAAVFLRSAQERHEMWRSGYRIMTPDDHQAAVGYLLIGWALANTQRGIDGEFGRGATNGSLQAAGAQAVPQARAGDTHLYQPQRAAVAVRQNRFSTVVGDNFPPAAADFGERFLPADLLPLAASFGAGAAQRFLQAIRVVHMIEIRPYLGAEPPLRDWMFTDG